MYELVPTGHYSTVDIPIGSRYPGSFLGKQKGDYIGHLFGFSVATNGLEATEVFQGNRRLFFATEHFIVYWSFYNRR